MQTVKIEVTTRTGEQKIVAGAEGQSLMEALRDEGLVEAICGGQAACATCHVHIAEDWMARVGPADGQERDMLETSLEFRDNSRLSCQISLGASLDGLAITIAESEG